MPFFHLSNQGQLYPFGSDIYYMGAYTEKAFSKDCPVIYGPAKDSKFEQLTIEEFGQLMGGN